MKYLQVTKVNLSRTLAYPARFFIWMAQTLASFFIFPFIWLTVYQSREMIGEFSRADIVTYYVLAAAITLLVRAYLQHFVQQDIIRGELSAYLTKPFPYLLYYRFRQLAFKSLAAVFVMTFFLVLLGIFPEYIALPKSGMTYLIFFCLSFSHGSFPRLSNISSGFCHFGLARQ
ncbi:MAG: ABC-2 family transporter protein, partial [Patescibacteria group bacterium]